jgi:hypothetical protein
MTFQGNMVADGAQSYDIERMMEATRELNWDKGRWVEKGMLGALINPGVLLQVGLDKLMLLCLVPCQDRTGEGERVETASFWWWKDVPDNSLWG